MKSTSTQCNLLSDGSETFIMSLWILIVMVDDDNNDSDYVPESNDDQVHLQSDGETCNEAHVKPIEERAFIVYESSLRELFNYCQCCQSQCEVAIKTLCGTQVTSHKNAKAAPSIENG
ncbi:hypothetical protein QZH41_013880 [Actinostola sp. cb2023]|nr:hypothetical protein QZH41_013880 [Actinostola sp. cb2023]